MPIRISMNASAVCSITPGLSGPSILTLQKQVGTYYSILMVDDDTWFRLLVRRFLEGTPYRLIEAQDGIEGIALLRSAPIDLLMTDIVMPELGGLAVIDAARSVFRGTKILAVSGAEDKDIYLRAAEMMGADATLTKPITKGSLLEALGWLTRPS